MQAKAELRLKIRSRLAAWTPEQRADASLQISRRIASLALWKAASVVGLYAAQEPVEPVLDHLLQSGSDQRFAFPRLRGLQMDYVEVKSLRDLVASRWGLREPLDQGLPLVRPEAIDLFIVPGVAFDRAGNRLGRGGGFYDRILEQITAPVVGACFSIQLVEVLPVERHDRAVNFVVTEDAVLSV